MQKLLVIEVAGLGWNVVEHHGPRHLSEQIELQPMTPCFPAVTCCAQAAFRTATAPFAAGIVANGRFDRVTGRTDFWNQSARLVRGRRIWEAYRARGGRVGMLFWQQSLGEGVDLVLSPAPIHKHHGGMIQDCYSQPTELYRDLCAKLGRRFNLRHYWGPMAGAEASRWIVDATCALLAMPNLAPDLLLTYLPDPDYVLQRRGPDDAAALRPALRETTGLLVRLVTAATAAGYEVLVWSDYAITPARTALHPNRTLRDRGLFTVRHVGGRTYPDLFASRAFAMVDHQVAHVFVSAPGDVAAVKDCFAGTEGIAALGDPGPDASPECGEVLLTAAPGYWFAYPWWTGRSRIPDYARHVDIHNKIGFDPCELFWGWPPPSVSLDAARVRGTHGRTETPAWSGSTVPALRGAPSLVDLARRVRDWLSE